MVNTLSSFSSSCCVTIRRSGPKRHGIRFPVARAQSSSDEGRSSISIVDANMGMLKERLEVVRMKERLQRWSSNGAGGHGWDYLHAYDDSKMKKDARFEEALQVAELIIGTFGLTIVSCTFCLCLVSLLAKLG